MTRGQSLICSCPPLFWCKNRAQQNPSHHLIILHSIRYVRYVPQFRGYTFLDRFLVPFLMAPTLKADDVATLAFAQSEVRKHDPKRESPSSVTRKSSSSVTRTRFLGCDPVPRLWREVCFCVVGVALSAIDGLLVWHVLCLVTSTLHFCRFSSDLTSFFLVWWACRACVYRNMNVIIPPTPPHPTPPHPTPPHPTPPHPTPPIVNHDERAALVWWACRACVCTGTWTLLSHPAPPPYPTHRKTHRWGENGVADEGKSGVFWGHRWGGFGVTDEGLTPKMALWLTPVFKQNEFLLGEDPRQSQT